MEEIKTNLGKVSISVEKDYWDFEKSYDRLTVVERAGTNTVYLSRKPVPIGTSINDRDYWIKFGKYEQSPYDVINQLGNDPNSAIAQQIVTREINKLKKQVSDTLENIQEAITLLSPDQQEAISIAQQVANLIHQINGYSLISLSESEYNTLVENDEVDENTLYFVEEDEEPQNEEASEET